MKRIVLTLGLLAAVNCAAMADGNAFTPLNFNDTAVPFIGSWKTLPIYLALLCSGSLLAENTPLQINSTAIFKMLFYSLTMLKLTFAMIC